MKYFIILIMLMFSSCHVVEYNLPRWDGTIKQKSVKVHKNSTVYLVHWKYLTIWSKDDQLSFEPGYAIFKGDTIHLDLCDSIPLNDSDYKFWLDCNDDEFID
tara:strand:- start:3272 stop:3577 length:306 start_codon:yes stop_codon:yes gene_type:complete